MSEFIRYLESLTQEDRKRDTAALAALRRGLSQAPGAYQEMYPYVLPHLSEEQQGYDFPIYCLIASLYALHPASDSEGNLGNHMRRAGRDDADPTKVNPATERRFVNLLRAHPDDLPVHLRQSVSFLKSKEVPVNWRQLLYDVLRWKHESGFVQKQWARGFWGSARPTADSEDSTPD